MNKISGQRELNPRNQPSQQRSIERRQQILTTTAQLLDRVGLNDLTTVLVAQTLGISVGSLYHYYPNKQAVLYALAENWLREMQMALDDISQIKVGGTTVKKFVDQAVERLLAVYRNQRGMLPLVQAMHTVPELRPLDKQHGSMVTDTMSQAFEHLGIASDKGELKRLASLVFDMSHALFLAIAKQGGAHAARSTTDLKHLIFALLSRHESTF